jgi:hypothetical protein
MPLTDEWQPIETAPRDGVTFLAIRSAPGEYCTNPSLICWNSFHNEWADNFAWDARLVKFQPTHWMPLPPPPMERTNAD